MEKGKRLCRHASVAVHAVEGGYRAHCLRCGALSPVRKERESALRAVLNPAGERSVRASSSYYEQDESLSAPLRKRMVRTLRQKAGEG